MRATSATVMVFFSKVPFWNLLDHNYDQCSFSTIERQPTVEDFTDMDQDTS